jgi:hypothetical protein
VTDTEKGFLRHLVAHKDRAAFDAYAKWLGQVGRHGDAERLAACAGDQVAADRELKQAAIALRADELLAADPEYAKLDPGSTAVNEARHRAQQLADNELHAAGWPVGE